MLRWRLSLGILIGAILIGLCWLEHRAALPGIYLFPLLAVGLCAATGEVLDLAGTGGIRPVKWPVYLGNLLIVAAAWFSSLPLSHTGTDSIVSPHMQVHRAASPSAWVLMALATGVILVFVAEMRRYERPGGVTINVAAAVFAIVYLGVLAAFLVLLRMSWGIAGVISVVVVTKMGDIGAYTVGRLFGHNKMAPDLSPGKTIEGAVGALLFSIGASAATFLWLIPAIDQDATRTASWGWIAYGLAVSVSGMLGDLAESLIKRDFKQKDSSRWVPGFGGVLDILDSLLFAAPVAYAFWEFGLVG